MRIPESEGTSYGRNGLGGVVKVGRVEAGTATAGVVVTMATREAVEAAATDAVVEVACVPAMAL